jgi:RNA polymerase sigma-70 factor, ECF subfamily
MFYPLKGPALARIATPTRRRSIDRLRKHETYARFEERFTEETRAQRDCWTHVHEDLTHGERKKHLRRALSALPELQRNAIHLAYVGEMSQREIAAHTGIALGMIKTRLELGLKKMACFLRRFEDLLGAGRRSESADINVSRDTARQAASTIMS